MQSQVKKTAFPLQLDFLTVVGSCSTPNPPDTILDMPRPPALASWYHLAVLELMLMVDCGAISELRKRTKTHMIISCELILSHHLMAKHVVTSDLNSFFSYLPEYVAKVAYMRANTSAVSSEDVYDLVEASLSPIESVDWTSELHLQNAEDAILSLAAAALSRHVGNFQEQVLRHIARYPEAAAPLRSFIGSFEEEAHPEDSLFETAAHCLERLMRINTYIHPDEMFMLTYRLWEWLAHTLFKAQVEDMLADYLGRRWQTIVEEQRFQLNRPMIAVPAIQAAIAESGPGAHRLAKLLLAAETAVSYRLGSDIRSKLQGGH